MRRGTPLRTGLVLGISVLILSGCAAGSPSPAGTSVSPSRPATSPPPAGSGSEPLEALDDGRYSAALYRLSEADVAGDVGTDLEAGTLVDLGDGCLGLEHDDGVRVIVAFPEGTALDDGTVTAVGMDPFGLGQPLRYDGATGFRDQPVAGVAIPDACPADVTRVWYFIAPSSAGIGSPGDD